MNIIFIESIPGELHVKDCWIVKYSSEAEPAMTAICHCETAQPWVEIDESLNKFPRNPS